MDKDVGESYVESDAEQVTAMTVKDLIEKLKECDQDKQVYDWVNCLISDVKEDEDGVYLGQ